MRTVFVIPDFRADTPTHFHYIYELVKAIARNADVFLIIEKGDSPDFLPKNKFYVQKFRFLPLRIIENLSVVFYARLLGYKDFYIHYSFLSAFNASLSVKFFGGRTFYWNCGLPWLYRKNFLRNQFERLVYQLIDFLVTGTESLKKEYAAHYSIGENKIKVMPNWVDLEKFKPDLEEMSLIREKLNFPADSKILLFVHRLSKRKGAHYLPEILKAIKSENAVLVVIGDGPERKNIQLQIANHQLQDRARFLGWVPNSQLPNYYFLADIFLMPSQEEGFPHVLLEAMAAGVPFVAFDVGGVREIIPPEFLNYLVAPNEIVSFPDKLQELLHKKAPDFEALRKAELEWARQFDLSAAIKKFRLLLA